MPLVSAAKTQEISQAADPKQAILAAVGDISKEMVLWDLILVGTFIRPEKTTGGIIRPMENVQEDIYQSKVGLVLKKGPESGEDVRLGDWIVYSIKDGWAITLNGCACRLVPYDRVRMVLSSPDVVF